ncbi:MAG: hypothetical protein PUA84_00265 [Oscillospiraceae bacterium]|nr:hypothetical protein [Oscillospiraceae bacterium]
MKRMVAFLTVPMIAISLTGCRKFVPLIKNSDERITNEPENTTVSEESSAEAPQMQSCTVGNISFEVPCDWEPIEGFEGSFTSPDKKTAFQLQGESILGSYSPEEFFDDLADSYSSSYTISYKDEDISSITTADGTECFAGRIQMTANKVLFDIDVLIAPDKNTVLTFASQCSEDREPSADIRDVTRTAVFNIGTEDMASGRKFSMSDGTEIHLNNDGNFRYFKEAGKTDSNYFEGTYETFYGQSAFDRIVSMTEYGLTEEELEQTLSANMNGYSIGGSSPLDYLESSGAIEPSEKEYFRICKDTFYAIVLKTTSLNEDNIISDSDNTVLFLGYYLPELQQFDMLNANSYNYTQWTEIK